MKFRSHWQEAALLLGAGARMMPLGNNRAVYHWLSERLECLHREGRIEAGKCPAPDLQDDLDASSR